VAAAGAETECVRIPGGAGSLVHAGHVLRAGELGYTTPRQAADWVQQGLAAYTLRVRVTLDGVLIGSRFCERGVELVTSEEHALRLYREGAVEVVDVDRLSDPAKLVPPPPPPPAPVPPVKVKALRDVFSGASWHPAGSTWDRDPGAARDRGRACRGGRARGGVDREGQGRTPEVRPARPRAAGPLSAGPRRFLDGVGAPGGGSSRRPGPGYQSHAGAYWRGPKPMAQFVANRCHAPIR
jgi:hypothetical protein